MNTNCILCGRANPEYDLMCINAHGAHGGAPRGTYQHKVGCCADHLTNLDRDLEALDRAIYRFLQEKELERADLSLPTAGFFHLYPRSTIMGQAPETPEQPEAPPPPVEPGDPVPTPVDDPTPGPVPAVIPDSDEFDRRTTIVTASGRRREKM